MRQARLLIAEDDPNMGALLLENLRLAGFNAVLAMDGHEARRLFATDPADLCILDVMLPKKDGFTLARELREQEPRVPFVFLTARNTIIDKKEGFRSGADDYITKPFELDELLMRINAILERTRGPRSHQEAKVEFAGFTLDLRSRVLHHANGSVELTEKELRLMHLLVTNVNEVVTRSELLERVWGKDDPYHSKSMDVYLTRLRKYLRAGEGVVLQNIHGRGYRLSVPGDTSG